MGPKKASPKVAGVKRKTPSEETTDVEGACAALGTEPEPKKATLDVGSAAKGGDTGVQRAGLTANNGEAPTMPSQSDIESGMAIQVNLDLVLVQRKMSLTELSRRIGISITNLSLLKTGKVKGVRFSTIEAICRELDCQPGELIEYVPDYV